LCGRCQLTFSVEKIKGKSKGEGIAISAVQQPLKTLGIINKIEIAGVEN